MLESPEYFLMQLAHNCDESFTLVKVALRLVTYVHVVVRVE
jgi:hypothetical protein